MMTQVIIYKRYEFKSKQKQKVIFGEIANAAYIKFILHTLFLTDIDYSVLF